MIRRLRAPNIEPKMTYILLAILLDVEKVVSETLARRQGEDDTNHEANICVDHQRRFEAQYGS